MLIYFRIFDTLEAVFVSGASRRQIIHFPMQEIGYFRNLLYINEKAKFCFHFCPPIVPEIFEIGDRL